MRLVFAGVVLAVALGSGAAVTPATARTYLAVPAADWAAVEPYVRANIVAYLNGDEFEVFICSGKTDRNAVPTYDESVGDFMKALLYQLLAKDMRFRDACENSAAEFRHTIPSLTPEDRNRFRELYWRSLSGSPDILPRVRREFDSARQRGRLRCRFCDKDPALYPAARRWRR